MMLLLGFNNNKKLHFKKLKIFFRLWNNYKILHKIMSKINQSENSFNNYFSFNQDCLVLRVNN